MARRKLQLFIAILLGVLLIPESVCDAALAAGIGRKRYTARLSSNKALRKQQLIVDPEGILGGSASVQYDPRYVRLVDVLAPADFEITGGFVGIMPNLGGLTQSLIPLDAFFAAERSRELDDPLGVTEDADEGVAEIGYVQIFFGRRDALGLRAADFVPGGNSVIPNLPDYVTVAEDGETGIADTHALLFEYLPGVPEAQRAAYRIFASGPRAQTVPDSIIPEEDPENPIPFENIRSASVAGSLVYDELAPRPEPTPVPLPPAAAVAGLGLGLLAGGRALKRFGSLR